MKMRLPASLYDNGKGKVHKSVRCVNARFCYNYFPAFTLFTLHSRTRTLTEPISLGRSPAVLNLLLWRAPRAERHPLLVVPSHCTAGYGDESAKWGERDGMRRARFFWFFGSS